MTAAAALRGARVRRVIAAGRRALGLELSHTALRGVLLCSAQRGAEGIGLVDALQPASESPASLTTLRSLLDGAHLEGFSRVGKSLWLELSRAEQRIALVLDASGAQTDGGIAIVRDGVVIHRLGRAAIDATAEREPYEPAAALAELRADGTRLAIALRNAELDATRAALLKRLRAQVARRERRLLAIAGDAARGADIEALRRDAGLVLAHLGAIKDARGEVALVDYAVEPPASRTLHIDPKLGARKQADAWFERARRLERGVALASKRAEATHAELRALHALYSALEGAPSREQLDRIADEARGFGVGGHRDQSGQEPKARSKQTARTPYREFRGSGDRPIWVGRSASDNDALTLRHARPHDLFLHVRDQSGSHVIVPLERDEACPPELLGDAATLAAHFSGARGEPRVDVVYTPRRYIQKPRKSAPGSVLLLREKVFRLILEPARLARLLAAEWAPAPP